MSGDGAAPAVSTALPASATFAPASSLATSASPSLPTTPRPRRSSEDFSVALAAAKRDVDGSGERHANFYFAPGELLMGVSFVHFERENMAYAPRILCAGKTIL